MGVYIIVCLPTGESYVGSTKNTSRRFQQHRYDLRRGIHHSAKMQAAWEKHGEEAFSFGHLVKCSGADLLRYEQHFIDTLKPEFNTEKLAGTSFGTRRTAEQRERLKQRPQSTATLHEFGGEMLTAAQIAERTGLKIVSVHARIRNGVPLDRPNQKGPAEVIDISGEQLTPKQIAERFDLPLTTVYSRLRLGWSGTALTQPRKHRARNSRG